jgi:RND family efflux transporter MFP subunit
VRIFRQFYYFVRYFTFLIFLFSLPSFTAADEIPVTVARLGELMTVHVYDAPADVVALSQSKISAEISAPVEQTMVRVGDTVSRGDLLAALDCEAFELQQMVSRAALDRVRAQLPYATAQLKRARELDQKKSISDELLEQRIKDLEIARADYAQTEQQLRLAERDVAHCQVRSPFNGVVLERNVSQGTLVSPGTVLFELLENDRLEITARVRRDQLESLQSAESIWFENQDSRIALSIRTVVPLVERASLTLQVRFDLQDASRAIAGDSGRLRWQGGNRQLPASLLLARGGKLGLFIVENDKAVFREVPAAIEGQPFSVDLDEQTLVVIDGRYRLHDGDSLLLTSDVAGS